MAKEFQLKRPLLIPRPDGPGQVYYSPFNHNLDYAGFKPDGKAKSIDVQLVVIDVETGKAATLKAFHITEDGFPVGTPTNAPEIQQAMDEKASLETAIVEDIARLEVLKSEKAELDAQAVQAEGKELGPILNDLEKKAQSILERRQVLAINEARLAAQTVPDEAFFRAFKYSEVIEWFERDGTIREEFLPAVMMIPFMGQPISEWVKIVEK